MLLGQVDLGADAKTDLDILAIQLTAALDGPLLLYLSASDLAEPAPRPGNGSRRAGRTSCSASPGPSSRRTAAPSTRPPRYPAAVGAPWEALA